ncbi:MAG: tetratricopeptide repeat protein [Tatlockia sp.]|jgi:predicted negative regulator of RcsB-dependent stress response
MSVYMTEEEQLVAIKKWWIKYSNIITLILALLLIGVAGYRYWNWHHDKVAMQASTTYEKLMLAFSNQDNTSIQSYANQLTTDYNNTVYADAARLVLARVFVMEEQYKNAEEALGYVATHTKLLALKQVAKIRLARLLAAEKSYDKALAELDKVDDTVYLPVINELKGDIFAATGQYQKAMTAYKEAINQVRSGGIGNPFLEMKTNELAALNQSMNTNDSALQSV